MLQSCLLILGFLVETNIAVPLTIGDLRVKRDADGLDTNSTAELDGCTLDDVFYPNGQEVPSLGPCESCVCKGTEVECAMVKCQQNSGCRIIQQSGQCCPLYKCDCDYNGQVYNNGERLDKPEDPCQVCYCKGGDIMCTSITCYERDDCQPHFSAGQCCPKYDHCPVETSRVSSNSVRSVNASLYSPKREMQPWPLTKPANTQTSTTYEESSLANNNVYPQTIKIVEILPTTPGYVNKPGEVSVIPRLKTNEQNDGDGESSGQKVVVREEETFYPSTEGVTTLPASVPASSTSEVEHLMETTTSEEEPSRAVISTLNPLSEEISRTNGPEPESDSQRYATVYPALYSTETAGDLMEVTTVHGSKDIEGSGYELLSGGLYEEDKSTEQSGDYSSENYEMFNNGTNSSIEAEDLIVNGTKNVPKFTPAESEENDSGSSSNETSVEMLDSSMIANETKENLYLVPLWSSENQTTGESKEDEGTAYQSTTNAQETTTVDRVSTFNFDGTSSSGSESNVVYSTIRPEVTSVISESTTESDVDLIQSTISTNPKEDYEIFTQTTQEDESSTSSGQHIYSRLAPEGRKKTSRLTYRNVDTGPEERSSLSIPPFVNVTTLGYNGTDPRTENATTMAKVGVYHPAKDNELAGFLTVVDSKSSTASGKLAPSPLLLTPDDLKKLAEILIHEKIIPVNSGEGTVTDASGTTETAQNPTDGVPSDAKKSTSSEFDEEIEALIRNIVSTTSSSVDQQVPNDDSNTSRQIRIPVGSSDMYTTPLDPRDLLILENFIRKNTGLQ